MPKKNKKTLASSHSPQRKKSGTKKLLSTGDSIQDYLKLHVYVENGNIK